MDSEVGGWSALQATIPGNNGYSGRLLIVWFFRVGDNNEGNAVDIYQARKLTPKVKMAYHCPACSRKILSRRNKLCSFCGEPLPAEVLFTPAEVEEIEAAERERALARKLREDERIKAARRNASLVADNNASFLLVDYAGG